MDTAVRIFRVFTLFRRFDRKTAFIYVGAAVLCVVLTDQISVHGFKNVFERYRPCHTAELFDQMRLVKANCGGYYGFVSSHATNTFGFAILMGLIFRKQSILWGLIAWATLISYSRIYLGVHFPLDVIGGGLLGSAIGVFCFSVAQRFMPKT